MLAADQQHTAQSGDLCTEVPYLLQALGLRPDPTAQARTQTGHSGCLQRVLGVVHRPQVQRVVVAVQQLLHQLLVVDAPRRLRVVLQGQGNGQAQEHQEEPA